MLLPERHFMIRYFKLSRLLSHPDKMVHRATSTETRLLTRDGDKGTGEGGGEGGEGEEEERGERLSDGSTADTARRKRPERPKTAARTNALGKLHCCWGTTRSERSPTFAAQFHLLAHDLFWANR